MHHCGPQKHFEPYIQSICFFIKYYFYENLVHQREKLYLSSMSMYKPVHELLAVLKLLAILIQPQSNKSGGHFKT